MPDSPGRSDRQAIPIGLFLHYLLAECGVSTHTLAAYRSDLMRFDRWRKSEEPGPLASLNVQSLGRYVDALSRSGLAPSSICRHLASLSTFFRFMVDVGRVPENLAKLLIAPAVWDRLPTVLGPAAVERLLHSPSSESRLGRRDRAALETLYATGCRASEVAGLRPVDLDLTAGMARCVGKGNKERRVPLGSHAIRALTVYLENDRPALVAQASNRGTFHVQVWKAVVSHRALAHRQAPCACRRSARGSQPAHAQA